MKATVPPAARQTPQPFPKAEPGAQHSEEREYQPRYVALPRKSSRGHGRWNLLSGLLCLVASAIGFAWAVYLVGNIAALILGCCLVTTMLLFVLARSRLLKQRNGGFAALASVCLLAVFLSVGWKIISSAAAVGSAIAATKPLEVDPSTASSSAPASAKTADASAAAPSAFPLVRDAFPGSLASQSAGPVVRLTRDHVVKIEDQQFQAKAGDIYPLLDLELDKVHIAVNTNEATLPREVVDLPVSDFASVDNASPDAGMAPARKEPGAARQAGGFQPPRGAFAKPRAAAPVEDQAAIDAATDREEHQLLVTKSQLEAVRRYPNLRIQGTLENRAYKSVHSEIAHTDSSFFKNPNWPLELAEIVAEKEGWRRADAPRENAPGTSDSAPDLALPTSP